MYIIKSDLTMKEIRGKSLYTVSTKKLGKGAFSTVYKGMDTDKDRIVAIKVLNKQKIKKKMQERLKTEIELHSSLIHESIIKIYDYVEDNDFHYLILEYCSHGDLLGLIKKGKITEGLTRIYTRQLVASLKYLKSKNIVHRDLKPHNILLKDQYTIKITDFNFARELWDQDIAETLCGSPLYMAPEIIATNSYTNRSDLWSVGMIIYEMLHGYTPFDDAINPIDLIHKIKRRKIECSRHLSYACVHLIIGLLTIKPESRMSWQELFDHKWIRETDNDLDTDSDDNDDNDDSESSEESLSYIDEQIKKLDLTIIDDYEPELIHSKPVDIKSTLTVQNKMPSSPHSLPINNGTNFDIMSFMRSSVGSAVRGTFNYLSQ
jgi:serine/threonine-protein kinase ULK/ATG1